MVSIWCTVCNSPVSRTFLCIQLTVCALQVQRLRSLHVSKCLAPCASSSIVWAFVRLKRSGAIVSNQVRKHFKETRTWYKHARYFFLS
jgi:hypothetical protein